VFTENLSRQDISCWKRLHSNSYASAADDCKQHFQYEHSIYDFKRFSEKLVEGNKFSSLLQQCYQLRPIVKWTSKCWH